MLSPIEFIIVAYLIKILNGPVIKNGNCFYWKMQNYKMSWNVLPFFKAIYLNYKTKTKKLEKDPLNWSKKPHSPRSNVISIKTAILSW